MVYRCGLHIYSGETSTGECKSPSKKLPQLKTREAILTILQWEKEMCDVIVKVNIISPFTILKLTPGKASEARQEENNSHCSRRYD